VGKDIQYLGGEVSNRRVLGRLRLPINIFPLSFEAIKERGIKGVR
jgi:hypothetical protein